MSLAPITYTVEADLLQTATYAGALDDISAYVVSMSFAYGMDTAMGQIAPPARAVIKLANVPDAVGVRPFNADHESAALLTNGDFSAWTAGAPDGWVIDNASAGVREATQVSADALRGGGGAGAVNMYWTAGAPLRIRQNNVLTQNKTYRARMKVTSVTEGGGVFFVANVTRVSPFYYGTGLKECVFQAPVDSNFGIQATSYTGLTTNLTIDDVELVELADYALLRPGTLVQISSSDAYGIGLGMGATFWQGRVQEIQISHAPDSGALEGNSVTLICECPTRDLVNAEYTPPLMTETSADAVIARMLDEGAPTVWPYRAKNWLLGVEGSGVLGVNTVLAATDTFRILEPGQSVMAFAGDASERGQGVSAMSYIQDLIAAELGRFFWNARLGMFVLNSRDHDSLDTTSVFTLTDAHISEIEYGARVFNRLEVAYTARSVGAVGTVVWQDSNLPKLLSAGGERHFNARYSGGVDNTSQTAAQDYIEPVKGLDLIANSKEDGTGNDMSAAISVHVEWNATSAAVTLLNNASENAYIQVFQLRATPLLTKQGTTTLDDPDSVRDFGLNDAQGIGLAYVADDEAAQNIGRYVLAQFREPEVYARQVQFVAEADTDLANAWFAVDLSTRVRVADASKEHDKDYVVVGIGANWDAATRLTSVNWFLKPAERTVFWRIEMSGLGELGVNTRLGF